ncbi:hypothetical protein WJX74_009531 [Apatococcus lobatus]|uniref:Tc1-like transposase DDE domain-containing protein n=1 Tax=Apatococcus lobatus TaxID=904363 RepID=A0AAW1Q975_9CHLO
MSRFSMDQFVFIDESAVDSRTTDRKSGWALRGQRTRTKTLFVRKQRFTVTPVMSCEGVLDWQIIEGPASVEDMLVFAEECLVPHLRPYPEPCSVVVLDNCQIHKDEEFKQLITDAGAIVMFLPPYSPDFNPIEKLFSQMKAFLMREQIWVGQVSPYKAIDEALRHVSPANCANYIASCGDMYQGD